MKHVLIFASNRLLSIFIRGDDNALVFDNYFYCNNANRVANVEFVCRSKDAYLVHCYHLHDRGFRHLFQSPPSASAMFSAQRLPSPKVVATSKAAIHVGRQTAPFR